jgi:putative transposase
MRRAHLKGRTRRAFRPCRQGSRGACGVAENLLLQDFQPPSPNRCWAGDITYIRTSGGWRYLAVWIDLFSRRVVGWKLERTMDASLMIETLNRALGHRRVEPD